MSSALPDAVNYHRWILARLAPYVRGPLLEVGCGYKQYTKAMATHVDRLVAIDIETAFLQDSEDLPEHVELQQADITDPTLPERLGHDTFRTIVCLNVLEHIEDDVATLCMFREMLQPGGSLLLLVPAHQALYGRMDELAGHYRRYSRPHLERRFCEAGLAPQELRYFNPLGGVGWWLNAKLAKPRTLSDDAVNRQIRFFDRYVQPLSRVVDPLTAPFFGQSLWARATR